MGALIGWRRAAPVGAFAVGLAALAGLAAGCDSPTIPGRDVAYDFRFLTDPPVVLRWPTGSAIRVRVEGGPDPGRAAVLRAAFRDAAAAWADAVLFGEYRFVEAARVEEADVVVYWSDVAPPVLTDACPGELGGRALTWSCPSQTEPKRLYRFPLRSPAGAPSDVRMLVRVLASEAADPARLRRLVLHELGHVLGIGQHSPDTRDVMWAGAAADRLSAADRATVQVLYHTPPDLVP